MNPHTLSVSTTGPGHSLTDRRISVTFACVIMSRLNSMLALFQNQSDDPNSVVLNSSPRAPRSAYFVCYSYRFRCLFYWNVSALRSGHHRIFRHDSSSKRTYIFHSKCIEVCKTWIKIVYIYRGIRCHTRPCVKTLRSANPWMNVQK